MKTPLLVLASCFSLGILLARLLPADSPHTGLLLAAVGLALVGGLGALRWRRLRVAGALVVAGFVLAGAAGAGAYHNRFSPRDIHNLAAWGFRLDRDVEVEGVVVTAPVRTPYGFVFDLGCRRVASAGLKRAARGSVRIRMFTPSDAKSWAAADALHLRYGDEIEAPMQLEKPSVYRNPGGFNFRWWMEEIQNISWEGGIRSPLAVRKLAESQASGFSMVVARVRSRLLNGIDRLYPPWTPEGRDGAVLKAVLLGDRSSLDSTTLNNFRQSGLYHLLVVAGLHIGLLAAVVLFFLQVFRAGESWRAAILLAFLFSYAMLVEQRAPTLRATLMIAAYLLGRFLYRDRVALNAVGFAALVLLVYKPAWLFEAGFDFSFSAALVIAALAIPILDRTTQLYRKALRNLGESWRDANFTPRRAQLRVELRMLSAWARSRVAFLDRHPRVAEFAATLPLRLLLWTAELALFSAIIQIGLFMPMAEAFHRITLAGIGLNTLALPLMTLLIAVAVPTVILAATLPALAVWPGKVLLWVTNAVLALTELPRLPAWMSYRVPGPPFWVAVGFALALAAAALAIRRSLRAFWASMAVFAVFALLVVTHPFAPRLPKGTLELTALDCGPGSGRALFAALPDGTTLLADACGRARFGPVSGRWDPGEEIVSPYLWSLGLERVDIVVVRNASDENLRALDSVLHNFKVRELWHGPEMSSPAYRTLAHAAGERGVTIREVAAGDQEILGRSRVRVLWPLTTLGDSDLAREDESPVVRIAASGGSALLLGRAEERAEEAAAGSGNSMASEVVELAQTDRDMLSQPQFLAQVNPRIVLITGGGTADPESDRPEPPLAPGHSGMQVFSTAADGAVTVEINGARLAVHCYQPPAHR
jgi:competence protein ComEC